MRSPIRHLVILASCSALLAADTVRGHHKLNEVFYDTTAAIVLKGMISRVDWSNPHVFIYLAVNDASGKSQEWSLEGDAPGVLMRSGWSRDSLKPGDNVVVHGFRPRSGMRPALLVSPGSS